MSIVLKIISGLFGIFAALFAFMAVLQNERHERTKAWFQQKWESLSMNPFLALPERVINAVILAKNRFSMWMIHIVDNSNMGELGITILGLVMFNLATFLVFGLSSLLLSALISVPSILYLSEKHITKRQRLDMSNLVFAICAMIVFLGIGVMWVYLSLRMALVFATMSMLIALPCYLVVILVPVAAIYPRISKKTNIGALIDNLIPLGLAVGLSFTITFLAFLVGNLVKPDAHVPQSFQMLVSNIIFDGATMIFTFVLLAWAIKRKVWIRIPIAITLDVLLAVLLACGSLYFGLLLSEKELSLRQVLFVLIGRVPTGENIELGPYFWAMHTTFLPTIAYLSILLMAWLGKTMLTPIRWFFGKGHEHKNPLALTAALFTLIATIFAFSSIAWDF